MINIFKITHYADGRYIICFRKWGAWNMLLTETNSYIDFISVEEAKEYISRRFKFYIIKGS